MNDTIRWGILATGDIAHAFARALALVPDATLMAVGSRTQQTAEVFGHQFNIPHCHGSYQALADDPDVDVVYVATPNAFHAENCIECLRGGKAVLCKKAFTLNAREAERVVRVAREERRFLMEAMYVRHLPLMRKIRELVVSGVIGDVRLVQANRCASGTYDPKGRHMNLELGGGSLLDVGIYPLAFASMVYGGKPPAKTSGYAAFWPTGADAQGAIMLEYDDGALASLTYALDTRNIDDARILGTKGQILIQAPFYGATRATLIVSGQEPLELEYPKAENDLTYEAAETMRCLREGLLESPFMPLDESIMLMRTMDIIRAPWGLRYPGE